MRAIDSSITVHPMDFSNSRYDGMYLLESKREPLAVMLRSKFPNPLRWCISYGTVNLFFISYTKASKYCEAHGFTIKQRPTK